VEIAACAMNTFTPTMMAKKAIMKPSTIKPVIWRLRPRPPTG
jgi:hypothetical protein